MSKLVIRDLEALEQYRGSCSAAHVEFVYGELALSTLGLAMAEDLLAAFRGTMPEFDAKVIVGLLIKHDLTFDSVIESDLQHRLGGSLDQ